MTGSAVKAQKDPSMQSRGAPLEVRQHRCLHGGPRKTKAELRRRWEKLEEKNKEVILPKCKSFPQYYESTYSNHGRIPGWSFPSAETPVSLLGERPERAREGDYGLGLDAPHFQATYADLGQIPGFEQPTYGRPVKHHTISLPVFPDVQDVPNWRPGVGPPNNPDPAGEAKFFRSTYMNHGEGFRPKSRGLPSKHHNHTISYIALDKSHGEKQKWDVLTWRPGVGDPVNPDPAKEGRNFSSTYSEHGNWHRKKS